MSKSAKKGTCGCGPRRNSMPARTNRFCMPIVEPVCGVVPEARRRGYTGVVETPVRISKEFAVSIRLVRFVVAALPAMLAAAVAYRRNRKPLEPAVTEAASLHAEGVRHRSMRNCQLRRTCRPD